MERRDIIKAAVWGGVAAALGGGRAFAETYYPVPVEASLWQGINRIKNPAEETALEKLHSPVITAPDKVKADSVFTVQVAIGRIPHPMGPNHWIEHLQLSIGNEPAGDVFFRSHGYAKANATFDTVLGKNLEGKAVSLIVRIKCNLHGIWQSYVNVEVV